MLTSPDIKDALVKSLFFSALISIIQCGAKYLSDVLHGIPTTLADLAFFPLLNLTCVTLLFMLRVIRDLFRTTVVTKRSPKS